MKWKLEHLGAYTHRLRRSTREIVIASVLTLAALAFLVAALLGGAVTGHSQLGTIAEDSGASETR